jgi:hypothetical protein
MDISVISNQKDISNSPHNLEVPELFRNSLLIRNNSIDSHHCYKRTPAMVTADDIISNFIVPGDRCVHPGRRRVLSLRSSIGIGAPDAFRFGPSNVRVWAQNRCQFQALDSRAGIVPRSPVRVQFAEP